MIELNETSYIVAIWFVDWKQANWMCCAYRERPGADWIVRYRFRYFEDERVFDSDDRRNWYNATVPSTTTEGELLEKLSVFAALIAVSKSTHVERIHVCGSLADLMEKGRGFEWFNMRKAEEAKVEPA